MLSSESSSEPRRIIPLAKARSGTQSGSFPIPLAGAKRARRVKLGLLLLKSGLISAESIVEALSISTELDQPIGKVLANTGQIEEKHLQSALLAQSMLMEGVIDESMAIRSLELSSRSGLSFSESLARIKEREESDIPRLDTLLLDAELVSARTLEEASIRQKSSGKFLGQCLIEMRAIVFQHLDNALLCLKLTREERISSRQASKALRLTRKENIVLKEALSRIVPSLREWRHHPELGAILRAGELIGEKESLIAIESSLENKKMLGEILEESGLLEKRDLENALLAQNLAAKGLLPFESAVALIGEAKSNGMNLCDIIKERGLFAQAPQPSKHRSSFDVSPIARRYLQNTDLLSEAAYQQAEKAFSTCGMHPLNAAVAHGSITIKVCRAAIDCADLVAAGELTEPDALSILHRCDRSRVDLDEALMELTGSHTDNKLDGEQKERWLDDWRKQIPEWSCSLEARLSLALLALGVAGAMIVFLIFPSLSAGYIMLAMMFGLGTAWVLLGRLWESRLSNKKKEIARSQEISRQTLTRLSRIKID